MSWRLFLFLTVWASYSLSIPEKPKIPIVFVEPAKTTDLSDMLTYPARLVPRINATVLSEAEGIVVSISAPLGRSVTKHQSLMNVKNTDPVYEYAPLRVQAPVSGVVSSVDVTEGSRVTKGQKLATITDPNKIRIVIEVAVSDLSAIGAGLIGQLSVPSSEDLISVKVVGISPFIDSATGTATAELNLVQKSKKPIRLPPGLVGRVSFKVREHKGFEVPESAIVYRGKDPFLRVVENGHAKYVPVTLGQTRRGQIEILKGLKDGTTVVERASTFVGEGEEVTIQKSEAASS